MAKQIKAMTSTLYLANEFIELFCFKTILVINENILVSKITMALVVNNISFEAMQDIVFGWF